MKKFIKKKYFQIVASTITALLMSFLMSAFILLINVWYTENFFSTWFNSWIIAFLVAWPVAVFVIPLVRKTVEKFTY